MLISDRFIFSFLSNLIPLLVFVISGAIAFSCVQRNPYNLNPKKIKPVLYADAYETSPDDPILLCGFDDLYMLFEILHCVHGRKFYTDYNEAIANQDGEFTHKTKDGKEVLKFDGACALKPISIYVTIEACEEVKAFDIYKPENYDNKKGL